MYVVGLIFVSDYAGVVVVRYALCISFASSARQPVPLSEGVRSGDVLFLHFSGHGAQQEEIPLPAHSALIVGCGLRSFCPRHCRLSNPALALSVGCQSVLSLSHHLFFISWDTYRRNCSFDSAPHMPTAQELSL